MSELKPEDYFKYRIELAEKTLEEVQSHLDNGFWNTAINRMYYACFYAIGALLIKDNISVRSHTGVRQQLGQRYVKNGLIDREIAKHFTELFEKRNKGDYNDFIDYDEVEAKDYFPKTVSLVERVKELISDSLT